MPESKELDVYSFEELPEDVQEELVEELQDKRRKTGMPFLSEDLERELKRKVEDAENIEFYREDEFDLMYSLGHSQGDGLMFTGTFVYTNADLDDKYMVTIKHQSRGNYYHEHTMKVKTVEPYHSRREMELDEESMSRQEWVEHLNEVGAGALSDLKQIATNLKKQGYEWQEDYWSKERCRERIVEQGKQYLEDGTEVTV